MRKLFLIMVLIFASSLFAQAPERYTGSGSVGLRTCQPNKIVVNMTCIVGFFVYGKGSPVPNAAIDINSQTYYTDTNGYVDISGFVSGGSYPYTVTAAGYIPETGTFICSRCRDRVIVLSPLP